MFTYLIFIRTADVAQACTVNENGRLYLFHLPFSSGVTINHGNNFFHVGSTPVTLLLFCDDGEFTAFLFVDFVAGVSDDKFGEHIISCGGWRTRCRRAARRWVGRTAEPGVHKLALRHVALTIFAEQVTSS